MSQGIWDVVIPEAGTNLPYNPCAVITGGLTAIGAGTVSRVTTYSYFGPACHRIVASADNTGGYFTLKAAANAIHYVTLRINSASDIGILDVSMDNSNWNDMSLLATEGSWWVYGVQIPAAQANASVALRIQQKGAGAIDLFIGHVQVEQNTYPTTPIWGDLPGFIGGYAWEGTPNGSACTRSSQERSGGRVVDLLETYAVKVRWASGIGMPPAQHYTQPQALLPGMQFSGQKIMPRVMDLTVVMGTSITPATIHSVRKLLVNALKLDLVAGSQPVKLRYRGALSTKPVEFNAVYDTGMEFDMGNRDFDETAVRLICYDPFAYEVGEASAQLTTTQDIANADYAVKRIAGTWSTINTAFNDTIRCFAKAHDGQIYIGGAFTDVGDGNGDRIVKYDSTSGAFTSLGSGIGNGTVYDMAVAPNGDLYVVGTFTDAGGVAAADYCAYWDISAGAWTAMLTGLGAAGYCIAIGQDGSIYIGGAFTNLTDGSGDYITKWTGAAFVSMSTGLGYPVEDIEIAPNGTIYAGIQGSAGTMGKVYSWSGSAWVQIGEADVNNEYVLALETDAAGKLYAGGTFTGMEDVGPYRAVWNGSIWAELPEPAYDFITRKIAYNHKTGEVFFTGTGSTSVPGGLIYNGYTWTIPPVVPPTSAIIYGILLDNDNIYLGYDQAGTAVSSYLNTITNAGTAPAYPVVHIARSGGTSATVQWLRNETTGATIYLNYALLDGEELVLDFRLGQRRVYSSYFGTVWRAVLRGSEFSEFYLQPGANSISAYVAQVGSPTMTQYATWTTTHLGADGAAA